MSLQASIAKLLLKLPASWLVKISGGKPVEIGGRTLDPYLQFVAAGAERQPKMSSMTAQEGRQVAADGLAMFAPATEAGVRIEDSSCEVEGRSIPLRLYYPEDQNPDVPLMVYYHMGGGVIGDLETCHAFCSMLASITKGPVMSVDYRLAPEHKWPAGLNDALAAYEYGLKVSESMRAPAGQAAVGGDSMGGNFSAILCQEMKRQDKPQPVLQLLIYPATDLEADTPSTRLYSESYPLSTDTMEWFMQHYLPEGTPLSHLHLSPMNESDLEGLAPAIVITAGFDPLVDQGKQYADRMADLGLDVTYRCFDSLCHGFTAFTAVTPAADDACREIASLVRDAYSG